MKQQFQVRKLILKCCLWIKFTIQKKSNVLTLRIFQSLIYQFILIHTGLCMQHCSPRGQLIVCYLGIKSHMNNKKKNSFIRSKTFRGVVSKWQSHLRTVHFKIISRGTQEKIQFIVWKWILFINDLCQCIVLGFCRARGILNSFIWNNVDNKLNCVLACK